MQRRPLFIMSTPYAKTHRRTDITFDVYKENSLKMYTRLIRGKGSRRKVTSQGKMPKNWPNFLQNEDNKKELYPFLADSLKEANPKHLVFVSKEDAAISNQPQMVNSHDLDVLEKLTVCSTTDPVLNQMWIQLDTLYSLRRINLILPTKGALFQHVLRAAYQAGYIWGQVLVPEMSRRHKQETC